MLPLSTLFLALMAITSVSASPIPFSQTGQSVPSGQLTSRNTPAPRFHSDIHLQQSVPRKRLSSSEKALLYRPRKRLDVLAKRQEAPAEGGAAPEGEGAGAPAGEAGAAGAAAGGEAAPVGEGAAAGGAAAGEGAAAEGAAAGGAAGEIGSGAEAGAAGGAGGADLTVVKFAALAETLEAKFYEEALAKFTAESFAGAGFADGEAVLEQISIIHEDEKIHLETLKVVAESLGGNAADIDTCQFNFESALSSVESFLATARVLEFVGVDAYIGGTTLIEDKGLLVSAAQIATVEARHNSVLNLLNGGSTVPSPFDMVLTPQQVLSLAAPFVSGGCDPAAALGLEPTPQLTVTNTETVLPGTLVTFGGAGLEGKDQATLFCNMIVGGAAEAIVFPVPECVVPEGLDGPVHLFITSSATPLASNIVTQDGSSIVAGPAIAFIDSIPNVLAEAIRGGAGGAEGGGEGVLAAEGGKEGLGGEGEQTTTVITTKIVVTKTGGGGHVVGGGEEFIEGGAAKPEGEGKAEAGLGEAKPEGEAAPVGEKKPEGEVKPEGAAPAEGEPKPEGEAKVGAEAKPEGEANGEGAKAEPAGGAHK